LLLLTTASVNNTSAIYRRSKLAGVVDTSGKFTVGITLYKGTVSQDCTVGFFSLIVFPSCHFEFCQNSGSIFSSRLTIDVVDTGCKYEKSK
jgi:hypothetical protein